METTEINYPKRGHLLALTKYHHDGGELRVGLNLIVERNFRSELKPATLASWQIGEVPMDISGYGKYAKSTCVVILDGKEVEWPFTMIYVES